jgi:uncharacterized protein YjcR
MDLDNDKRGKLDMEEAIEIRELVRIGIRQRVIAEKYGVSQVTISKIKTRQIYKESFSYGI